MERDDSLTDALAGTTARWWHPLGDGRIQCDLCPRECKLHEGQRAACFVRAMQNGQMLLTTYGRSSGFCIDPIEKKPLNHFYPGSSILSFGTAGCNLTCKFCQNWDISRSRDNDRLMDAATPQAIAEAARYNKVKSVAFTYNDPVIFAEYAMDTADACHALGVQTVAVTAGYMHLSPAREFYAKMDAANIDLKAFSNAFYEKLCGARLQSVLDLIAMVHHETSCWVELTTLLIPGENDSDAELTSLSRWVVSELGTDVPLHFTAFHPDWKMQGVPPTPPATLKRARHIARTAGLRYVYTGNVRDIEGGSTLCPGCNASVIVRDGYQIQRYALDEQGHCQQCRHPIAGHYATFTQAFGSKRVPVRLGAPQT